MFESFTMLQIIAFMLCETNNLPKRLRSSVDEDESKFRRSESVVKRDYESAKFQLVYLLM